MATPSGTPVSYKNRELRLQVNWAPGDWKNDARSDKSRWLQHSDGRVRIWRKQLESMAPSALVSTVQAGGGVMVWKERFSWPVWAAIGEYRIKPLRNVSCIFLNLGCRELRQI